MNRKIVRRFIQLFVLILFAVIPLLNTHEIFLVSGNFFAFDFFGVPFADPLAGMLSLFNGVGTASLFVGMGLVLLVALFLGPVFCSWICPYGFFADLLPLDRSGKRKNRFGSIQLFKMIVVALLGVLSIFMGFPAFVNQLSLPAWYSKGWQIFWWQEEIVFGVWLFTGALVLDLILRERFWCKYVCPQSLFLIVVGALLPKRFRVIYEKSSCICSSNETKDAPCVKSCPFSLDPKKEIRSAQCTNCGDCVVTCQKFGHALSQKKM